jgi:hypothetical protein
MIRDAMALRIAIDLMHVPSRVRVARSEPLPAGVETVLSVAAGDEAAQIAATASTGRSRDFIEKAAGFFIEQILLCPDADSYRVLGAASDATNAELRRNMALLMRWVHPDMDPAGQRSIFASRVTGAWNDLKTDARRAAYQQGRGALPAKKRRRKSSRAAGARRFSVSTHRHAHPRPSLSYAESQGLLRRVVAWLGALAQYHLG